MALVMAEDDYRLVRPLANPIHDGEAMQAALRAAGKTAAFKIYPDAPHGFHADYRPSYRKEAAEDAWRQMTAWFRQYQILS